jgi:hypothetical protein
VTVGTHENKAALIKLQYLRLVQRYDLERHAPFPGCRRERRRICRFGSKIEQDKTIAKQVKS